MKNEGQTVLWILSLGILTFLSLIYDNAWITSVMNLRNGVLNYYFIEFSVLFTVPVIIIILTIFFFKERKLIIPWWVIAGTTLFFTLALKAAVGRERPYVIIPEVVALVQETLPSFPSARTAVTFAALPLIRRYLPRFYIFWLLFGLLVAFSRVYLGVHFFSDIFAGMLMGYLFGKLVLLTAERTLNM
jgi:undecaprenyl-diphosphatase